MFALVSAAWTNGSNQTQALPPLVQYPGFDSPIPSILTSDHPDQLDKNLPHIQNAYIDRQYNFYSTAENAKQYGNILVM